MTSVLEIKHLRMVRMLHQTGNMTRAAQHLFITQPALSQQLKEIENRLGADLFFRTGKKMVITPIGNKLLSRADTIIQELETAELEIAKAVHGDKGELRIGVRCLFCYQWLPRILKTFQHRFPNVDISVTNSVRPNEDLVANNIHIAISAADTIDNRLDFQPLFDDEMLCTMSTQHPLSQKKWIDFKDFQGAAIIALVEKPLHSFYESLVYSKGIVPKRYMTVPHPDAMVDLIAEDIGIGIMPRWYITPMAAVKQIKTAPLTAKGVVFRWKATFLKTDNLPVYHKAFLTLLSNTPLFKK